MTPTASTGLYGVIGCPVGQSLGPVMHNAAFRAMDLDAVYLAFDSRDPAGCLEGARALGIRGLSVTMPHKTAVLPLLDHVDEKARRIGAVNTVVNDHGRLVGFNTDGAGALEAIRTRIEPRGLSALVVGAGGAGHAVACALAEAGARLIIANRSREHGKALAGSIPCPHVPLGGIIDLEFDILVQASSVGMVGGPAGMAVPREVLQEGLVVLESVYRPEATELLLEAQRRGCVTVSGVEMFVRQGAEQIRLWTGREPPVEAMRRVVSQGGVS
ncbi:MAG: shikimate dehydrogenase [Deltaproteobacteria bacterium]|nr:shikimate dehydrogenase [Deltaproteobacteria bacterium]